MNNKHRIKYNIKEQLQTDKIYKENIRIKIN